MKWLKILLALAEIFVPGWGKVVKDELSDDSEVALVMLKKLTLNMTPEQKGRALVEAVGNLKDVKKFKKRVSNRIDKAQERWARKLF